MTKPKPAETPPPPKAAPREFPFDDMGNYCNQQFVDELYKMVHAQWDSDKFYICYEDVMGLIAAYDALTAELADAKNLDLTNAVLAKDMELREQLEEARRELGDCRQMLIRIEDDGPETSCSFIDGVIKRFPEAENTMERIRTINTQLRYNLMAVTEERDAERALADKLAGALEEIYHWGCDPTSTAIAAVAEKAITTFNQARGKK